MLANRILGSLAVVASAFLLQGCLNLFGFGVGLPNAPCIDCGENSTPELVAENFESCFYIEEVETSSTQSYPGYSGRTRERILCRTLCFSQGQSSYVDNAWQVNHYLDSGESDTTHLLIDGYAPNTFSGIFPVEFGKINEGGILAYSFKMRGVYYNWSNADQNTIRVSDGVQTVNYKDGKYLNANFDKEVFSNNGWNVCKNL